nr:T9SS type A sorting domain-containing protein [Saprospiraceae bacterium]
YNNPYGAPIIYYGIGTWQDIYNPNTRYQEQISGAGAFGTYFWMDRVRGISGVVFTSSLGAITRNATFQIVDAIRDAVGLTTGTEDIRSKEAISVFPNPVHAGYMYSQTVENGPAILLNTMGQVVMHFKLETLNSGLNIQHLPPGLYFLKSAWGTTKIVILKS